MMYRIGWISLAGGLGLLLTVGVGMLEKRRATMPQVRPATLGDREQFVAAASKTGSETGAETVAAQIQSPIESESATIPREPVAKSEVLAAVPAAEVPPDEAVASQPTPIAPDLDQLVEVLEPSATTFVAGGEEANSTDADSGPRPDPASKPIPEPELDWHEDYQEAWQEAAEDGRMLLIYFHDVQSTAARRSFEQKTLAKPEIKARLVEFVLLRLPVDAATDFQGRLTPLLRHPAFAEMQGRSGIAIIDLAHRKASYYRYVVSTFPFTRGKYYRGPALEIILSLPPGTLTQRTMIYAVRTHPEAPASTQGNFNHVLAEEAKLQSDYQAKILVQGHQNWENRFHRINARLPGGATAQEVVAESWPNESLVDACVDCVDSWRQSPGHWNAVRSRHPLFGFDIKRGRNGIWYATGIFGRR